MMLAVVPCSQVLAAPGDTDATDADAGPKIVENPLENGSTDSGETTKPVATDADAGPKIVENPIENGSTESAEATKPEAVNDKCEVKFDSAVTIDVLKNDSCPNDGTLTIDSHSKPKNGEAKLDKGKITYTPDAGYVGEDSFTYVVSSDSTDGTATAKVTIKVQKKKSWYGDSWPLFIVIGLFVLMMVFSSRSKRKQARKRQEMLETLKKGDKIVTIGGIRGTVMEIRQSEVVVKVDETNNIRMRFTRSAIHVAGDETKEETK